MECRFDPDYGYQNTVNGKVVEWFNTAALKTVELKGSVGSNPTFSANASVTQLDRVASFYLVCWGFKSLRVLQLPIPIGMCPVSASQVESR